MHNPLSMDANKGIVPYIRWIRINLNLSGKWHERASVLNASAALGLDMSWLAAGAQWAAGAKL